MDALQRLAVNDERVVAAILGDGEPTTPSLEPALDPRSVSLVRLAALIATGGGVPSYGAQADAAVSAGATAADMVDVLVAVAPVVGVARVVAAAPKLALALGYDVEQSI